MARKKTHEDHANHEAWAIPYGDLLTLLLALFVVLYSMSSVNEGKYRVLSDSLNEAFGGRPRSPSPIQIGDHAPKGTNAPEHIAVMPRNSSGADNRNNTQKAPDAQTPGVDFGVRKAIAQTAPGSGSGSAANAEKSNLTRMSDDVKAAMGDLIAKNIVAVHQTQFSLEIEIRADILFPSGVAQLSAASQPVLMKLASILKPFPNPVRIEGHTDNVPINSIVFPSNWQLSAARAASVVGLFMQQGVEPTRMNVTGYGEYHPVASNDTAEGRNHNRRVLIVVLGNPGAEVTAQLGDSPGDSAEADPAAHEAALASQQQAPDPAATSADGESSGSAVSVLAGTRNPASRLFQP